MSKYSRLTSGVAASVAISCYLAVPQAQAFAPIPITLTDGNSLVDINPYLPMGMNSWKVESQEQLFQQWFWYRVGNTAEQSIDAIGTPTVVQNSLSQMTSTYSAAGFSITILYDLLGGAVGSGQSTVNESITINNTSGSALDFHFFQYSDYALGGVDADTVQMAGDFSNALVTSGASHLGEVVVSPGAILGEVAPWDQTLLKLNDADADTLNGSTTTLGPGDITFAFQWDFSIAAGGSKQISKVKSLQVEVVPEPTTAALGLLGVSMLFARRFFRK